MFEYEWEGELEAEGEAEAEYESEAFFRGLAGLARRAVQSPALRRLALRAARAALQNVGGPIGSIATAVLPQREYEGEFEGEFEGEEELNPIRRVYPDALMEHLGHAAAGAQTEEEAEAFLGALVPMAARMLPRVAPVVMRAAPQLIRGVANVGRTLLRSGAARPLVRAVPTIVRGTVRDIARQVARGRSVTPRAAVQSLARQTARILSSPRQAVGVYRRSRALDRTYHRSGRRCQGCTRGRRTASGIAVATGVVPQTPVPAVRARVCPRCGG